MGARTVIKKGAQATSKFAKAIAKLGGKAAPVTKLLTLSANAVGFLSKNLWLLAVGLAYMLYEKKTSTE